MLGAAVRQCRRTCSRASRCLHLVQQQQQQQQQALRRPHPRRLFSSRVSSSSFDDGPSDYSSATSTVSDRPTLSSPVSAPLGSLSAAHWEALLESLAQSVEKAHAHDDSTSVYWMNKAEKILNRLLAEQATRSLASRSRDDDLLEGQLRVLLGWCQVLQIYPNSRLSLERAPRMFWNLIQRSTRPWWATNAEDESDEDILNRKHLLLDAFISMIQAYWLNQELSTKDFNEACRLLLWKDLPELLSDKGPNLGPVFAFLMQQAEMLEMHDLVGQLNHQWNRTSSEDIEVYVEALRKQGSSDEVVQPEEVLPESHRKSVIDRSLSAFEIERMAKQTVTLLQSNNPDDKQRIETVIGQWENLIAQGTAQSKVVVDVILDYYARSGDTSNAIKWLSRLDLANPSDLPKGLNHLIVSLAKEKDPSALFRAEEILRQLENIGAGNALDPGAYAAVAERWLQSNESQANRRVMELCFRPASLNVSLVSILLRGIRREKTISADMVNTILQWYMSQTQSSLDKKSREELMEGILFVLQRQGESRLGWDLFRTEVESGTIDPNEKPFLCELVVASLPNSAKPDDVIEVFHFLESRDIKLGIEFFQAASKRLVDLKNQERLDQLMLLYEAVLRRVQDGMIRVDSAELSNFLGSVFELLNYWKRDDLALKLLSSLEATLLSGTQTKHSSIPVSCYTLTANTLSWKGKLSKVEELYKRLKNFFDAGYSNLRPNNAFAFSYARALSSDISNSNADPGATFQRLEDLLAEMKGHFQSTNDEQYKPLPEMYKTALLTLARVRPIDEIARSKAESLLDDMISTGAVNMKDPDPFTSVMHIILQSPSLDKYNQTLAIRKKMIECKVQESEIVHLNVLRACTRAQGNEEREGALTVALESLAAFRKQCGDKASPYGVRVYALAVESVVGNLSVGDKRKYPVLQKILEYCQDDGYLDAQILEKFRKAVSKSFFHKIYESHLRFGGYEPDEWSRNVVSTQQARV